jgi:hypothetical protein
MSNTTQAPTPEAIKNETGSTTKAEDKGPDLPEVLTADQLAGLLHVNRKTV